MKTSTLSTPASISTTDLMCYDGEYKTDLDKFRDMSGVAQAAIVGCGIVTVAAAGYAIYKGIQYIKENNNPNPYYNTMYPQMQQPQYYQNPLQQSAVNIQGHYTTNDNQQPTVSFQANSTPVQPQYQQPQMQQQPQQFQRIVLPNGQIQDVPINPQPISPIYQQPANQAQ